jgi:hypothetical protein
MGFFKYNKLTPPLGGWGANVRLYKKDVFGE